MGTTLEYREGYDSYGEGIPHNPYDGNTDEYNEWEEGYNDAMMDDKDG